MKNRARWLLAGLVSCVLVVAWAVTVVPIFAFDRPRRIIERLDMLLSRNVEGWEVRDLDLANSAEMRDQVFRVLRFDDVVYRRYSAGSIEVDVYVAYWKPGTVPYGQAGVHTPDTCWVNGGWKEQRREHARPLRFGHLMTKPAEVGEYSMKGERVSVAFWHLVGGRVHSYEQYGWKDGLAGIRERLPHFFADVRRYGLNLAQEQVFVRISTNLEITLFADNAAVMRLIETLRPLAIFADRDKP
jgi:hypothetical protein